MPCSPGMRGCRLDCAHRRFVTDYAALRDEQLVRAEAATGMNDTELDAYFGADGEGDAVESRWTFKRHLESYSGLDYPYPRADRTEPDATHDTDRAQSMGQAADR